MKKHLALIFLLTGLISFSQESIEKTVGEFKQLKVYDLIEVELIKSDIDKVVISGKNTERVNVVNKSGKLKIKMKLEEIFDGNQTTVKLYYTNIEVIDANEGAKVRSDDTIKQFEIDLKAQEGGAIDVPIEVTFANSRAVTGGIIDVTGKAQKQDVSLLTGGMFNGEELQTENTEVRIRAAGEAHVNASVEVDVKIRAGGDVYIYGEPKKVNESRVFGGRIKHM